jgi:hypothetical protein
MMNITPIFGKKLKMAIEKALFPERAIDMR